MYNIVRFWNAAELVKLFMLCFPEDHITTELQAGQELDGIDLVKVGLLLELFTVLCYITSF